MDEHVEAVLAAFPPLEPGRRRVVAIAGPPAAGKSTFACSLVDALGPRAAVLGMDAFHYDDAILVARGDQDRKGAPHTFDVEGYRTMLERLRVTVSTEVAIPVFDRSLELTRAAADVVPEGVETIVTEGNWLLLQHEPWASLQPLFDLTVALAVPDAVVEARILERWREHGLDDATALSRAEANDLPNARTMRAESAEAMLVLPG